MPMNRPASRSIVSLWASLLALACSASPAAACVPDYGFQWATITHAGNRPVNQQEAPDFFPPYSGTPFLRGSVNYEYRIATTEVTTADWLEFVNAYAPYYSGARTDSNFTSRYIHPTSVLPSQPLEYRAVAGTEQLPATMAWYYAARYVNWLENGKANTREAFERGVYDTSTFVGNPDDGWQVPADRAPGARFWIPTLDEWIKAAFYDPDRYGPGEEGYWKRPNGGDGPLIPGYPEDGGQTSAGIPLPADGSWPRWLPVGAYPDVQSPWGLLDVSGGMSEWMGDGPNQSNFRYSGGSFAFITYDEEWTDRIDAIGSGFANIGGTGFRLASVVPAPGSGLLVVGMGMVALWRRRR